MKNNLLKLVFIVACIGFVLSGCEKDLYENQIKETEQGKINFVSINEVPFLIPTIEKFNPAYRFLSNPNVNVASRGIEDLNLDLDRIIEYVNTNEIKSYSILVNNEFESNEDKYIENLHVVKIDDQIKPFLVKYNATDDAKEFNINNFTGKIQIATLNSTASADLYYENGLPKFGLSTFDECVQFGFIDLDCILSGMGALGMESFTICFNCSTPSNAPPINFNTAPPSNTTNTNPTVNGTNPNQPNSGNSTGGNQLNTTQPIVVVPNVPLLIANPPAIDCEVNNTVTIKNQFYNLLPDNLKLCMHSKLGLYQALADYLSSQINEEIVNNITRKVIIPDALLLAKEIANEMCGNAAPFTSITPFIIEKQIDDTNLDPCTKGILNKLKQNHAIAKIIARFDNPQTPFTINFSQIPNLINPQTNSSVYGLFSGTNQNYNYNIQLNANNFNNNGATSIGKAATIIHEIIHALIGSVIQYNGTPLNTDNINFPEVWNSYLNIETGSSTPEDHTFMGNNYVNIIGSALQEFATNTPLNVGQVPDQLYLDLAWGGIYFPGNNNFNSVLTGIDKARIFSRKTAEMTNSSYNGVNPSNNSPCIN